MYVIGDVHGQMEKLSGMLRGAGLVDADLRWAGGDNCLLFVGDFFDRGPDGVGAVELVMRLQGEARAAGGRVEALLGNHDALILAARRFGGSFAASWRRNGGVDSDLARLDAAHVEWVTGLPALALVGGTLYAHADATFYARYGDSIGAVNAAFRELLRGDDAAAWDGLLDDFSERRAFDGPGGAATVARFLGRYGGRRLVHGHTPIQKATGQRPERVVSAHEYAGGLCVNVDGGMYLGGPGFVYEATEPHSFGWERVESRE